MPARPVAAGRVALVCLAALVVAHAAAAAQILAPALAAAVEVRLPADAELWFDGVATPHAGDRSEFRTPPLRPGLTYRYEVQARWREGGREVVRGERVIVRAGESVVIDFTRPRVDEGAVDHMAVREVAPLARRSHTVPAAHDSLVELPAGQPAARRLPGHMAVTEFDPTVRAGMAAHPNPAAIGHMSIMEFDTPRP